MSFEDNMKTILSFKDVKEVKKMDFIYRIVILVFFIPFTIYFFIFEL